MGEYIGVVSAHHEHDTKQYVWLSKPFECFKKGEKIVVETSRGLQVAIVDHFSTINNRDETIDIIMNLAGSQLKRVVGVVREINYEAE